VNGVLVASANWNRPMLVVAMICFTIISCYLIVYLPKWFK